MKLVEFSVTNYRSITTANKIELEDLTVLVGKNNEGKSNLLKALNTAMDVLMYHSQGKNTRIYRRNLYRWDEDFPVQFQNRKSGLESIFRLHFRLEGNEINEFHKLTNIYGNENIPIVVKIGKNNVPKIEVKKKGSPAYNQKSQLVTEFICKRLNFNYIPAIRTEDMAIEALYKTLGDELIQLKGDSEYEEARQKVHQKEQDVLDRIANQIKIPLSTFLPSIKDVFIEMPEYIYHGFRNAFSVQIDDGQLTNIANKGDGVKNLITMAILQEQYSIDGASIVAIEEPESHLHPGAIHGLVDVINKMSKNKQVIITTHNPLFVKQNRLSSNIIVDKGTACAAKNIEEIRSVLGVKASDNLIGARYVLLVEGENDKLELEEILSIKSETIRKALESNELIIRCMGGTGNLEHDIYELKGSMCNYVVLLDNDASGKKIGENAINKKITGAEKIKHTICPGLNESELEDCINPDIYRNAIEDKYSVKIDKQSLRGKNKWSVKMKTAFQKQGTKWTDSVERDVKLMVAESVISYNSTNSDDYLVNAKSGFIDGLVTAIEKMMEQR